MPMNLCNKRLVLQRPKEAYFFSWALSRGKNIDYFDQLLRNLIATYEQYSCKEFDKGLKLNPSTVSTLFKTGN